MYRTALVEQIRRALASGRTLKEMEATSNQYTITAAAATCCKPSIHRANSNDDDILPKAERSSMHGPQDGIFEDVALESILSPAPILSTMPEIPQQAMVPSTHGTDTTITDSSNTHLSSPNNHRPNGLFGNNHSLNGGLFADISSTTGSLFSTPPATTLQWEMIACHSSIFHITVRTNQID